MKETEMKRVPKLRFPEFTDDWEQRKLGEILQERNTRTSDFESNPLYSLTIESGVTPKTDRYERSSLVTKTEDLFKIVKPNEFVTNPMNLRFGALGYNQNAFTVSVSGYYDVFSIDDDKCSGFWNSYFKTHTAMNIFDNAATGSLIEKRRVKYSTLQQLAFYMPNDLSEKAEIGKYMNTLDHLITLHQRKLEKLKELRKGVMQKLFSQEVRFKADDGSEFPEWEKKPFGDVVSEFKVKTKVEDEDTLLSCAINGMFLNSELFGHQRGQSNIGYLKIKKGTLILSAQNLHLGNANVNLRFEHGIISPAYKTYDIVGCSAEYMSQWAKCDMTKQFFYNATTVGASECRRNVDWNMLYSQLFAVPCLAEQQKIADCLSSLDEVIEKQKATLAAWEELKKGLLQQMFV